MILCVQARPIGGEVKRSLVHYNSVEGAKTQGPGTGGGGHGSQVSSLGGMRDSGPSPGEGHGATAEVKE